MIEEISIRDLGVIAEARLPLGPGFTAVTGETGAGKTMVVSALGLLLGDRADSGTVRSGATQAVVEGRWMVPAHGAVADRVRDAGGDVDVADSGAPGVEAELLLGRSVSSEGRSRVTVGGRSAPVGVLTEIGEQLVVVHGQSEQLRLRSPGAQLDALDRFAGDELRAALGNYQEVFRRWQSNQSELEVLVIERDRRAREARELRVAMADIEALAPRPGEDAELAERAERLTNLEDLRLAAAEARAAISAEFGEDAIDALARVETARRALERMVGHDATLAPVLETLASASFTLSEASGQLSHYLGALDADGARELDGIQERRAALSAAARRYEHPVDELADFLQTGSARLLELDSDSDRIEELEREVAVDGAAVDEHAARVTAVRTAAAGRLAERVTDELQALAMADARLGVELSARAPGPSGGDAVSIVLSAHSGAEPRPLSRGASGGELSRVMLAIEVVLAGSDPVPTFVFDEVDAGVGGASATEIGRRLARLSSSAQVIVVTHLAQVAAFATNHLAVVKSSDGAVTASDVRRLTGDERVAEMARLLSGMPDSESGLIHARELLELASAEPVTG